MANIRWGIIGCGDVTEVKSGPGFQKAEGSELVAVMRRDGEKARDYARRHGVPRWYDDADALIADEAVDAVYVATPPSSHAPYAMKVALAGKPVYVEKPMALDHRECQTMVQACADAGTPLFVAYYRRTLPSFQKVVSLVREGAIGSVRYATIEFCRPASEDPQALPWRVDPALAGGGYFFDLASHQLDFLDYLLGPIVSASGHARNQAGLYAAEDAVSASFAFDSGVLGAGLWNFAADQPRDRIEVVGEQGRLVFSAFKPTPVELIREGGSEHFDIPYPEHVQQPLIQTIVDALRGRGECPSTGVSAARTSGVMDQIIRKTD